MKEELMRKVQLTDKEMPTQWYNIQADIADLPEYINPQTKKPITAEDLSTIFPPEIIKQEMSKERYIDIPEPVQDIYHTYRPTNLHRAYGLERLLGTPAKIFYKYEGGNATGSHKLNSAVPQAYYNKLAGITRLTTETGAGQWGSALSMACCHFGLECQVYMVKVSYNQKPFRRTFMQSFGASVDASPSPKTAFGRNVLATMPETNGTLGIAISEAVEDAVSRKDTNYALGSVLNHVGMHQTIIGLETQKQFEKIDMQPDVVIACVGGGSNFAGFAFPYLRDKIQGKSNVRVVAVESSACPTLTKGIYAYDYSDVGHMCPITKMYTLGSDFMPSGVHAGGLRYHGMNPIVSKLYHDGYIEAVAYGQLDTLKAGLFFAQAEGIVPAPESTHAIKAAIDEAEKCKEEGVSKTIVFCLSGNGYFDMYAYDALMKGELKDSTAPEIDTSKIKLPEIQL